MPYPAFVCEYRALCLRGAVQKAERRTDWCQVHGLTLQLQQRQQGLFWSVLGFFYSLPMPHPLAEIHNKKMDWIDIHPVWGDISFPSLHFDICLKQSAYEKQPVTALMHKLRRKCPDKGRKHSHGVSASCREHCPQPFCVLLTVKELFIVLLISVSHLMTVFHKENDLVLECLSWVGFDRNA